ncbi:MAG: cytidine deaminase [Chitinophagaceae bacterium]
MKEQKLEISYLVFESSDELEAKDKELLNAARQITKQAYAPYSKFYVGAAALLANGEMLTGTNQENASYPVGICAERVLLSTISSLHPQTSINTMAVSYDSDVASSDHPISPCGMCRQFLQEFENRFGPFRIILGGMKGRVMILNSASQLLPFAFTREELS